MADDNEEQKDTGEEQKPEQKPESKDESSGGSGMLRWAMIGVGVIVLGAAGGYLAGTLIRSGPGAKTASADTTTEEDADTDADPPGPNEEYEYSDFDEVLVNLNEPSMRRYVAVKLSLAVRAKDKDAADKIIEKRKEKLLDWLNLYLSGLTLEDVRGPMNRNRIRREIEDNFNRQLWPNAKPLINHIVFEKFTVQ